MSKQPKKSDPNPPRKKISYTHPTHHPQLLTVDSLTKLGPTRTRHCTFDLSCAQNVLKQPPPGLAPRKENQNRQLSTSTPPPPATDVKPVISTSTPHPPPDVKPLLVFGWFSFFKQQQSSSVLQELHRGHVAGPHLRNLQHLRRPRHPNARSQSHHELLHGEAISKVAAKWRPPLKLLIPEWGNIPWRSRPTDLPGPPFFGVARLCQRGMWGQKAKHLGPKSGMTQGPPLRL